MRYFIGADLGTSALKLLLTDENGNIVNSISRSYDVYYPQNGWSEQNPQDWWTAFTDGIAELKCNVDGKDICGIGVAGQMHGLVILDASDAVIRPAILWNDGRTDKETEYLNTTIGKKCLSDYTANIAFAGFTAPKILWLKANEPENFDKIEKIMLPKDYINYLLTGEHITDYSDASGMLLLDVQNKCWSAQMLSICEVRASQLPRLCESTQSYKIDASVAKKLGINPDCLVVAGAGDNAAAAIGTGTIGNGRCNISLGTSGTVFISSDTFSVDTNNALHAFCHADGGYHLMGCMLSAASCNKWFCDNVLETDNYATAQDEIADTMLGENSVYFLPYLMGERSPLNDTDASGVFIGLRPNTSRADMVQAIMEGVAFAIRDSVEVAKQNGIRISASTLCGGGAKSELWRKILCNILNMDIEIPEKEEGPGFGAAMLAMTACGAYESIESCKAAMVRTTKTIRPQPELAAKYDAKYKNFSQIYPALKAVYKTLNKEAEK